MMKRLVRANRKRRRQQGGFTLIELLVVITILGILAAIVSVSLLGITATARQNALKAEKQTVQTAFDAMLHDQHVDPIDLAAACKLITTPTNKMTQFPTTQIYQPPDSTSGGRIVALATHYLRQTTTQLASYTCDGDGNVLQTANP